MNLIKCPAQNPLMTDLLERSVNNGVHPNEDSTWLGFTQLFYQCIVRAGLEEFIRRDLMPPDSWQAIKPLIEGCFQPDDGNWYAIHLLNEMWNELQHNGGVYKGGSRSLTATPTRTILCRARRSSSGTRSVAYFGARVDACPAAREYKECCRRRGSRCAPRFADMLQLNAAITSMSLGGAERIVSETGSTLGAAGVRTSLYLLHDAEQAYSLENVARCRVTRTAHLPRDGKLRLIAAETALSSTPAVFIHLLRASDIEPLAQMGTAVIAVVHNAQPGWFDPPRCTQ